MGKILIAPSFLSANFLELKKEIDIINESLADWFHIDVMDGVFVPNISFGFPIIKQIKKLAQRPLDVHLMIVQPERYLKQFKEAGADVLTVHYEAVTHLHRTVMQIKELEMQAGVALNPHTPVSVLEEILPYLDMVLIMSVNPGFGGQKFIETTYNKIRKLRKMAQELNPRLLIEVDGGVNTENAEKLAEAGVNVLVAGSAIFKSQNPAETIKKMKFANATEV